MRGRFNPKKFWFSVFLLLTGLTIIKFGQWYLFLMGMFLFLIGMIGMKQYDGWIKL